MMSGIFTSAGQKWLHKKQSLCTSVSNASWWKIYTKKTAITASLKLFWNLNTQQQTGSSHFFTVLAYFGSEVFFFSVLSHPQHIAIHTNCISEATGEFRVHKLPCIKHNCTKNFVRSNSCWKSWWSMCIIVQKKPTSHWTEGNFKTPSK